MVADPAYANSFLSALEIVRICSQIHQFYKVLFHLGDEFECRNLVFSDKYRLILNRGLHQMKKAYETLGNKFQSSHTPFQQLAYLEASFSDKFQIA